ncbi:hypothetical protein PoB_000059000 [Plakobranchus ocellatus]|uniref:rhomboid protease n=1 Tax=Plakobranchus ocellatus TaxID=259542 RepID=A0AAV3XTI2_9GAST|nr:hypothetical protein PoB_000059000 [Plakobranchus ocellatus]
MALSYSRTLILRPQKFRKLHHTLNGLESLVSESAATLSRSSRVYCCLRSPTNHQATQLWTSRLPLRGFRTKKNQTVEAESPSTSSESVSLLRPFLYTFAVCGVSFTGAMILNYEYMRRVFQELQNGTKKESESPLHKTRSQKAFGFRDHLNSMWSSLTNGQKIILGIVAANIGVFFLWKVPSFQSTMIRYFSSAAKHPLPSMTLSSFSHISFLHLFVNMYVLWSFATVGVNMFGTEQFGAFYLSAATFSSFASIASIRLLRRPMSVSVGASGAIMALIGAVCVKYPNAQLSIAFVSEIFPHSFSADTGMKCLIAFDVLGLVLGWRFLDHAGHLGGMLFGLLYTKYGNQIVWGNKETIMRWWHNIRGKP